MRFTPSPVKALRIAYRNPFKSLLFGGFLILMCGSLLQLALLFFRQEDVAQLRPRDYYDVSLSRLNTLDKLVAFIDSLAVVQGLPSKRSPLYVNLADSVLKQRFYYGRQNIPFTSNYIANLGGKYVWDHLMCKVDPEDILQGQKAFCSQSSMVFQEVLKRKGYDVRTVMLPGHFCTEVFFDEKWNFFDVSYKPSFASIGFFSTKEMMAEPDIIVNAYLHSFNGEFLENYGQYFDSRKVQYGEVNAFAAQNMLLFHRLSWWMSWFGWLLPGMMLALVIRYEKQVAKGLAKQRAITTAPAPAYIHIRLPYESDVLGTMADVREKEEIGMHERP